MLDQSLRGVKEQALRPIVGPIATVFPPIVLTALGLIVTLGAAAAAALGQPGPAVLGWLLGRVLDGLDGEVARHRGTSSDLGGYLDLVADTVGYAAIPLGVAIGADERATWMAAAVLLTTFYLNAVCWLTLAAVLEKRGAGSGATGERTTVTMPPSLIEGTETVIFFTAILAFPGAATALMWVMALLVTLTIVHRIGSGIAVLSRRETAA